MRGARKAPIPKVKCSACMYGPESLPSQMLSKSTLPPVSRLPLARPLKKLMNLVKT